MRKFIFRLLPLICIGAALIPAGHAAATTRPNILLCIADDASYFSFGAYGSTWVKTPNFDSVARQGILFNNAYTPNAKCSPSRSCILTGRNPWQLEAAGNHNPIFPKKFTTFMEALKVNGYTTGFTGKGWAPGNAGKIHGKKRELAGKPYNSKKLTPPTNGISPVDYAANFDDFLNKKPKDRPFCFWFGGHEPHRGYEYGSGEAKGGMGPSDIDRVPGFWPDNKTVRTDMLDYAYEVEYFDKQLGRVLETLKQHGELDNTLIVVTSDNGMPFPRIKGNTYEFANHMPFAVMWKNKITTTGRKVNDYISFIDITPTFLAVAQVAPGESTMKPIAGKSFLDIIESSKSGTVDHKRDHVLVGRERNDVGRPNDEGYPMRGIVKDNYIYVRNYEPTRWPAGNPETGYMDADGGPTKSSILEGHRNGKYEKFWDLDFGKRPAEELYNIKTSPFAMINLAGKLAFTAKLNALKTEMEIELEQQHDPRMSGHGDVFDEYPYANRKVRNFYNRYMNGEKMKTTWINNSDFESTSTKASDK